MANIEIIGLGAGDLNQLPLGVYHKLKNHHQIIYTRTIDHPVLSSLKEEGVRFESFDSVYEEEENFERVYERIVAILLEKAKEHQQILYTVPGHPMLAERTVQRLLHQSDVEIKITGGNSYLDSIFTTLKIDPIEGFQFVDGASLDRETLNYEQHTVICQVYDSFIASHVKIELLEDLPPDYEVTIVDGAGTTKEKIEIIPLEQLDRHIKVSNLTSVYVPPAPKEYLNHRFDRLREVMRILRSPEGCPWDWKQTHESLRQYAIEEVHELIEAIDNRDDEGIVEELGDILMHVVLHSQIGEDNGYFSVDDVIKGVTDKMIHRHPHVFGNTHVESVEEVNKNWDELKKIEKGAKRDSVLDGIPNTLPALAKAYTIQKKAAKVGFDWDEVEAIWEKLDEEISEVKEAIDNKDLENMEKEFGDVLFVLANLTRYYKINPETALIRTNEKFYSRFTYIEEKLKEKGKNIENVSLEEMDAIWDEAKERE